MRVFAPPRFIFIVGLLITGLVLPSGFSSARADEISQRKADKIREMIKLSAADTIIDAMLPLLVAQMKNSIRTSLPNAQQKHVDLLADTITEEMQANSPLLFELMIPPYDSLLSEETIDDVIAFYKTPSGQKLAEASPHLSTIGATVGQQWAQMVIPKATRKAIQKARELGYEL